MADFRDATEAHTRLRAAIDDATNALNRWHRQPGIPALRKAAERAAHDALLAADQYDTTATEFATRETTT